VSQRPHRGNGHLRWASQRGFRQAVSIISAMVDVSPFRGLRFSTSLVGDLGQVIAPPYDVISRDEHRELLARSHLNVVRLELPASESGDPYEQAARSLEEWRSAGVLVREDSPCLYLYEVRFGLGGEQRTRRSLVAALRLETWESGQVLPHEQTMAAPKQDRLRLLRATRVNISPLWTLYSGPSAALEGAWQAADDRSPESGCELPDGTAHRLWRLEDQALIEAIRADFAPLRLVVADGHHRYETALSYRDELAGGEQLAPDDPARFVLAHLVADDDPGLAILPTHRLVRELGELDQVELEAELGSDWHGEYFPIWEGAPPEQLKALLVQLHNEAQTERVVGLFGPDSSIFSILILRNKQLMEQRGAGRSEAWRACRSAKGSPWAGRTISG
jgi:uncharacterized protein (DUF1015 family)